MSQESELLEIAHYAKALRLPAIGANFADILAQAKRDGWSHTRFITELLSLELNEREARRCQRLLIEAKTVNVRIVDAFAFFQINGHLAILSRFSLSDFSVIDNGFFIVADRFASDY